MDHHQKIKNSKFTKIIITIFKNIIAQENLTLLEKINSWILLLKNSPINILDHNHHKIISIYLCQMLKMIPNLQRSGIGSRKEKSKQLKTKDNVDLVGLLQPLVQLKLEKLSKTMLILKTILNKCWLIVISITTIMDAMEVGLQEHMIH